MAISDPNSSWENILSETTERKDIYKVIRGRDNINFQEIKDLYQHIGDNTPDEKILVNACHRRANKANELISGYLEKDRSVDDLMLVVWNDLIQARPRFLLLNSLKAQIESEQDIEKKRNLGDEIERITESLLSKSLSEEPQTEVSQEKVVQRNAEPVQPSVEIGISEILSKAASNLTQNVTQAVGAFSDRVGISTIEPNINFELIRSRLPNLSEEDKARTVERIIREREEISFSRIKDLYSSINDTRSDERILLDLLSKRPEKSSDFMEQYLSEERKNVTLLDLVDSKKVNDELKGKINSKLNRDKLAEELQLMTPEEMIPRLKLRSVKGFADLTGFVSRAFVNKLKKADVSETIKLYQSELENPHVKEQSQPILTALRASLEVDGRLRDLISVEVADVQRVIEDLQQTKPSLVEGYYQAASNRSAAFKNDEDKKIHILNYFIERSRNGDFKSFLSIKEYIDKVGFKLDPVAVVKALLLEDRLTQEEKLSFVKNLGPMSKESIKYIQNSLDPELENTQALSFELIKRVSNIDDRFELIKGTEKNFTFEEFGQFFSDKTDGDRLNISARYFEEKILPGAVNNQSFVMSMKYAKEQIAIPEGIRFEITANASLNGLSGDARKKKIAQVVQTEPIPSIEQIAKLKSIEYSDFEEIANSQEQYNRSDIRTRFALGIFDKSGADLKFFIDKNNISPGDAVDIMRLGRFEREKTSAILSEIINIEDNKKILTFEQRIFAEGEVHGPPSNAGAAEIICDHFLHSEIAESKENKRNAIEELVNCGLSEKQAKSYYFYAAEKANVEVPKTLMERITHFADKIFTSEKTREKRFEVLSVEKVRREPRLVETNQPGRSLEALDLRKTVSRGVSAHVPATNAKQNHGGLSRS